MILTCMINVYMLHTSLCKAHAFFYWWCCLQLPSYFCDRTRVGQSWLNCCCSSQSVMWFNSSISFCFVVWGEKNCENLCSEFSRKNVLLNALCLLTSLSCQFFCSVFVVAKDLCASSFVSDLRCQRCPFDVECRPHTRHHLCSSHSAPVDLLVCLHMCE